MLIVCSGPDTFRALQKARELENAFKQKFDKTGLCVERIASGKEAVAEIAARSGTVSLFASRRFVRTTNVLAEASKAQRAALSRVLAGDQEGFILLTLEDEPPNAAVLEELKQVKVVRYDFPLMDQGAYVTWAREEAYKLGIKEDKTVQEVVEGARGDSWTCFYELLKRAAYDVSSPHIGEKSEGSIFTSADAYIRRHDVWREVLEGGALEKQALAVFLSQVRTALRVRDGATEGVHPFVARKLRGQALIEADEAFAQLVEGYFMQRSGYADEKEMFSIL